WSRPIDSGDDDESALEVPGLVVADNKTKRRKRKRSKHRFYRRPLFVVPMVLLLVCLATVGTATYRAESTIATLQQVSTPPPVGADNTVGDDPVPTGVAIDSSPARQAVAAANQGGSGSQLPTGSSSGGVFGAVKDAASGAGDLAAGAAVAAGVTDP